MAMDDKGFYLSQHDKREMTRIDNLLRQALEEFNGLSCVRSGNLPVPDGVSFIRGIGNARTAIADIAIASCGGIENAMAELMSIIGNGEEASG
jgi:hypothetical protein